MRAAFVLVVVLLVALATAPRAAADCPEHKVGSTRCDCNNCEIFSSPRTSCDGFQGNIGKLCKVLAAKKGLGRWKSYGEDRVKVKCVQGKCVREGGWAHCGADCKKYAVDIYAVDGRRICANERDNTTAALEIVLKELSLIGPVEGIGFPRDLDVTAACTSHKEPVSTYRCDVASDESKKYFFPANRQTNNKKTCKSMGRAGWSREKMVAEFHDPEVRRILGPLLTDKKKPVATGSIFADARNHMHLQIKGAPETFQTDIACAKDEDCAKAKCNCQ